MNVHKRRLVPLAIGVVLIGTLATVLGAAASSPAAAAPSGTCFDPVPDPFAAGWVQDGNQPTQGPGSPLIVRDPSNQPGEFISFHCLADAHFAGEIALAVTLSIDAGFQADGNDNIGVHVTINNGITEARAMLFDAGGGRARVALIKLDGSRTPGFTFPGLTASFRLKRLADGTGVLSVPGSGLPDEQLPHGQQAGSSRPGLKTLEFGSHKDYGASSTMRWETLGLPPPTVAGELTFTRFRLRDVDSSDRVRFRADFTLGAGSDGINPSSEPVTIKLSTPAGGQFYPSPDYNPITGFDQRGNTPRRRWSITAAEAARTGVERFDIDEGPNLSGAVDFRDARTALPAIDFSTVSAEIVIGNDRLTGTANLVEQPPGSGRWRQP